MLIMIVHTGNHQTRQLVHARLIYYNTLHNNILQEIQQGIKVIGGGGE